MRPFALSFLLIGTCLMAACSDVTGVAVGSWAAHGIELRATVRNTELRLPCGTRAQLGPLRVDEAGRFILIGRAASLYSRYDVRLRGRVASDTIHAELTSRMPGVWEDTRQYLLLQGGDPAFDQYYCLGAAPGAA